MTVYFLASGKRLTLENKSSPKINQKLLSASVKGGSLTPGEGLGWPGLIGFFISTYSGEIALKAVREKSLLSTWEKMNNSWKGQWLENALPTSTG